MKNIRHIILAFSYVPGSAHVNRILGYKKGYEASGLKVTLVVFCIRRFGCPSFISESVFFCKEPNIPMPVTRMLIAGYRMRTAIKNAYNHDDTIVHIYNTPIWANGLNFSKMDVFFEKTEIPFYAESNNFYYKYEQANGNRLVLKSRGLLCITSGLESYFSKLGVKNIEVVNMFVDSTRFKGIQACNKDKYIFYCGNISCHKDGVDVLIKAFKKVHDKYPQYKLRLVGGFERLYNDEHLLRELVKDLGLENSVDFTGRIQPDEMPQQMKDACILALARPRSKQATYGFPTKVGEYLCAEKPVVLTDVGEITNYLKDGVNCLISKPNNEEEFAAKMIWAIENPVEANMMASIGGRLVNTEFSSDIQSKKAIIFFSKVINE